MEQVQAGVPSGSRTHPSCTGRYDNGRDLTYPQSSTRQGRPAYRRSRPLGIWSWSRLDSTRLGANDNRTTGGLMALSEIVGCVVILAWAALSVIVIKVEYNLGV
jgi:hypothetical protein